MRALAAAIFLSLPALAQAGDQLWVAVGSVGSDGKTLTKHQSYAEAIDEAWQVDGLELAEEKKREVTGLFQEEFRFKNGYAVDIGALDQTTTRYVVRIQIKDGSGALLTTEAKLSKGGPMIFRGPAAGGESPILIVEFR